MPLICGCCLHARHCCALKFAVIVVRLVDTLSIIPCILKAGIEKTAKLWVMEFPLTGSLETNGSEREVGSLYRRKPATVSLYVAVLGVAAVVGTLGNVAVIVVVTLKHIRRRRNAGSDVGRAFIANLASSDLIVTSVINPLAIAGLFASPHAGRSPPYLSEYNSVFVAIS